MPDKPRSIVTYAHPPQAGAPEASEGRGDHWSGDCHHHQQEAAEAAARRADPAFGMAGGQALPNNNRS